MVDGLNQPLFEVERRCPLAPDSTCSVDRGTCMRRMVGARGRLLGRGTARAKAGGVGVETKAWPGSLVSRGRKAGD
ncbi:hypothetical protein NL676_004335 [Syzygium grande]|nr:hypothetical protein NL676_004335 [Syzygium grande]